MRFPPRERKPLSAMVLPHPSLLLPEQDAHAAPNDVRSGFQHFIERRRRRRLSDITHESKIEEYPSQMQITMLIIMPSRRHAPSHAECSTDGETEEVLEYSFGTLAVPWDSDSS
jgi:hypothetical protein